MENKQTSVTDKVGRWARGSVSLKMAIIFVLMLLLLIPVAFVQDLIKEREAARRGAIFEVNSIWANSQTLTGPLLVIPVRKQVFDQQDKTTATVTGHVFLLPSTLQASGSVSPEKLSRGIYEIIVYNTTLQFTGGFSGLKQVFAEIEAGEILWQDAFITLGISDLRGIKNNISMEWNGLELTAEPGTRLANDFGPGVTLPLPADSSLQNLEQASFNFELQLQGSESLNFVPTGRETTISLQSPWPSPSFGGAFLPDDRQVSEQGFSADWKVLQLNRNYPQFWNGKDYFHQMQLSAFGVSLMLPVDDYQKANRSARYALLAISLTFLCFFLVEILNGKRVHPFQYTLVGLALCLFYVLLVSLSEHTTFNMAYLLASIIIINMIGLYGHTVLKETRLSLLLGTVLSGTYAFLFVTMQMEDYALLIGSLGLTTVLGATMYLTRNINWYQVAAPARSDKKLPPADTVQ